nr:phospholipase-like protein [Tanacetum cinerariifolium]
YWADYDNDDQPIPFRRRVFPSSLDGKHITGNNVEELIKSKSFSKLDDDDAVSLCCIGILQLVLLGVEDRRAVPNWILRLANDRDGWDDYPWGSYVWPTLYYQLKDENVRRWLPLYAAEPTNEVDKKSYSIFEFTWAFKTWILEVFREGPNEYYTRHRRYPKVVAWSSSKKFYRHMLRDFLHEQRSRLDQMMKHGQNIFEKMNKFMEVMSVGTGANKEPIIVDQHYRIINLSGFQSIQGGPSYFQTSGNNSSFNMGTPINWQTKARPSQPGSSLKPDASVYANSKLETPYLVASW